MRLKQRCIDVSLGAVVLMLAATAMAAPTAALSSTANLVEIEVDLVEILPWSVGGWSWYLPSGTGSFSMSGDLTDEGGAAGTLWSWSGSWRLTLVGSEGSLTLEADGTTWEVMSGTGAYAGASGGGSATYAWGYGMSGWTILYFHTYSLSGTVSLQD